ncbi:hypothetical protein, partial [Eubacterium callanderi]|uniref:hypothetical protein n=1 Tax=Eubacterium callanderi TaxID=53442 RepID=UPI001A9B563B
MALVNSLQAHAFFFGAVFRGFLPDFTGFDQIINYFVAAQISLLCVLIDVCNLKHKAGKLVFDGGAEVVKV